MTGASGPTDDALMTGEAVGLDVRPTGFVLRAAGAFIDLLLSVGVLLLLLWLLGLVGGGLDQALVNALTVAILVVAIVLVPMTVELASHGRSLGRWAVGARIVREDGGATQLRHAFVRALLGSVEIYLTFGGLAAVVALLDAKARRLGDLLAGTYSQLERVRRVDEPAFGVPTALVGWAQTADVARLPDRLGRRIAAFLRQAGGMSPSAREGIAAELAAEAAMYVAPVPPTHPELLLAAVAAVRRERDATALELERRRLARLEPILTMRPHGFPARGDTRDGT